MEPNTWCVVVTRGAEQSLEYALDFYRIKLSPKKLIELKNRLLERAASLSTSPYHGQLEPTLEHLDLGHRRIIEGHFKIIYKVVDETVFVTDIFDSQMDPAKMKR